MKTFFANLICCKDSQPECSVITLNSQSQNEKNDIVNVSQNQTMQETRAKFQDNLKTNKCINLHRNSPNNSNSFISCQSQLASPSKVKSSSNLSILTVENIHIKESNFSLPEVDTELVVGKELRLTGELFWNKEIIIDRLGIKSNKRKKNINVENVFGLSEAKDRYGRCVNDFILNYPFDHKGESSLFSIKYLRSEETYEMTMLNKDLIIYHLVDYSYFFNSKSEQLFLIGKILVTVKIDEKEKRIEVMIKDENKEKKEYCFKEHDIPIVIGRVNSTITIPSNSISKNHAIIDYSDDKQMYFIQDMGSTNKTYKLLNKGNKMLINNEMKFKLGELKFEIHEMEPK